ncbi:MAG: formate dehydrogenase accessory sulfurtransferase FdhD [Candidatus Bipolaricaulota bacterium]|nr:formate dehydrogenase accessory sulfurtransferase FdhD [Candidatus Bipolaricaulota bacterium]
MARSEEKEIVRWESGQTKRISDDIVVESSLDLVVNDRALVTLMCSPEDHRALSVGYLRTEGLIERRKDLNEIDYEPEAQLVEMRIETDNADLEAYFSEKRALTSGCGNARAVVEKLGDLKVEETETGFFPEIPQLTELMKELQKKAELFKKTGGSHTAALAGPGGIDYLAEDIGRHNAVDKVIGKSVIDGRDPKELVLLTSGRLSSEMVSKAIRSSISKVASRSAPTTLAVRMGRITGLAMVGFVRGGRLSIYSGEERFKSLNEQ